MSKKQERHMQPIYLLFFAYQLYIEKKNMTLIFSFTDSFLFL